MMLEFNGRLLQHGRRRATNIGHRVEIVSGGRIEHDRWGLAGFFGHLFRVILGL